MRDWDSATKLIAIMIQPIFILIPPRTTANRFVTQNNVEQDNLFNVHGFTETFFNKKVTFSMGGSFTTIDTDLSGSRIYGPSYKLHFKQSIPTARTVMKDSPALPVAATRRSMSPT